jgi:hypothetical protein
VKSDLSSIKIDFDQLTTRLRAYIRLRINSGEFTERSLARIFRISQPHLHNVLKGVRRFTIEFADQVMLKFEITILDLITEEEIWNYFDETNPEWLTQAAKRKPTLKSEERATDLRAAWRVPKGGS